MQHRNGDRKELEQSVVKIVQSIPRPLLSKSELTFVMGAELGLHATVFDTKETASRLLDIFVETNLETINFDSVIRMMQDIETKYDFPLVLPVLVAWLLVHPECTPLTIRVFQEVGKCNILKHVALLNQLLNLESIISRWHIASMEFYQAFLEGQEDDNSDRWFCLGRLIVVWIVERAILILRQGLKTTMVLECILELFPILFHMIVSVKPRAEELLFVYAQEISIMCEEINLQTKCPFDAFGLQLFRLLKTVVKLLLGRLSNERFSPEAKSQHLAMLVVDMMEVLRKHKAGQLKSSSILATRCFLIATQTIQHLCGDLTTTDIRALECHQAIPYLWGNMYVCEHWNQLAAKIGNSNNHIGNNNVHSDLYRQMIQEQSLQRMAKEGTLYFRDKTITNTCLAEEIVWFSAMIERANIHATKAEEIALLHQGRASVLLMLEFPELAQADCEAYLALQQPQVVKPTILLLLGHALLAQGKEETAFYRGFYPAQAIDPNITIPVPSKTFDAAATTPALLWLGGQAVISQLLFY